MSLLIYRPRKGKVMIQTEVRKGCGKKGPCSLAYGVFCGVWHYGSLLEEGMLCFTPKDETEMVYSGVKVINISGGWGRCG